MMKTTLMMSLAVIATVAIVMPVHAATVGYWNFDNDSYANQAGPASDGALSYGNSVFSTDVPAAIGSGKSGSFDGGSAIEVPTTGDPMNSTTFTLSYFIKPDTQVGTPFERITARDSNSFLTSIAAAGGCCGGGLDGELSYYRTTQNTNDAESWFGWDKTKVQVTTGGTTWSHVAWVNTAGGDMKLYVNGVQQTPAGMSGDFIQDVPTGSLWFGGNDPGVNQTDSFRGLMDDVLLTDDALSAADIAFIANNGVDAFLNPTVPAPEPSSMLLVVLGLGVLGATRRRNRR